MENPQGRDDTRQRAGHRRSTQHRSSSVIGRLSSVVLLFLAAASQAEKFHDTPPGGPGGIRVAVQPIADLEEAIVVEATEYKTYLADIDRGAGTVAIRGLPPGKYDLVLKFRDKVFEGITLDPPDGLAELPRDARDGVEEVTWMSEDYFNIKRIVRMGGNPGTVKLLVEQVRDKKTFDPGGTVLAGILIRRLDLCELRKTGKIWTVKMNRHLFREERKMGGPGTELAFGYAPALSSIRVGDEVAALPDFDAASVKRRPWPHFYTASWREKESGGPRPRPKTKPKN